MENYPDKKTSFASAAHAAVRSIGSVALAGAFLFTASLSAQTDYTWNQTPGAGVWGTESPWSPGGGPPGALDTAIFDSVGTDVRFRADATVANLNKVGTLDELIQNDQAGDRLLTITGGLNYTGAGGSLIFQSNHGTDRLMGVSINNLSVTNGGVLRFGRYVNANNQFLSSMNVSGTTTISNGSTVSVHTRPAATASFGVVDFSATGNNRLYLNESTNTAGQLNNKVVEVAGLTGGSTNTRVAIQAGNNAGANTTLRLDGAGTYSFAGRIFNNDGGGAGSMTSVEITGGGTQILTQQSDWGGDTTISNGALIVDGSHIGRGGDYIIGANGRIGGGGTIGHAAGVTSGDATMTFEAGAQFVFDPLSTLTINENNLDSFTIDFGGLSITDLVSADGSGIIWSAISDGTYTLVDGTATLVTSGMANFGAANAADIGGGRSAYFQNGSLQLVVIPEPGTYALFVGLLAVGAVFLRRRRS